MLKRRLCSMNIKRHNGTIEPQDIINAVQVWSKLLI